MSKELQITVLFEEEPEGGYTVTVPSLPGCVSYGKTLEAAKKNIQNAVQLHLACISAHSKSKKSYPIPKNIFTAILHFHLKAA
jgi:antitoxin HicB